MLGNVTMADTMDALIAKQREQLTKERADVVAKIAELEKMRADIDRRFAAILAYESALSSKPVSRRRKVARRGGKQAQVLTTIKGGGGMTRGEIIAMLGVKGDKSAEQSVSNALNALKKSGTIVSTDGKWSAAVAKAAKRRKAR
jgi:hypothetical protein